MKLLPSLSSTFLFWSSKHPYLSYAALPTLTSIALPLFQDKESTAGEGTDEVIHTPAALTFTALNSLPSLLSYCFRMRNQQGKGQTE